MAKNKKIEDIFPLSPMQAGMLFHTLNEPGSGAYVEQLRFTLEPLDSTCFRRAWEIMFARFPALRTSVAGTGREEPVQVVRKQVDLPWTEQDCRGLSSDKQTQWIEAYLGRDGVAGFQLKEPSLVRLMLVRLSEARYELIWTLHHIVLDGWSSVLIQRDLFRTYEALTRGTDLVLPPVPPFRDYINWLHSQDLGEAEAYWRKTLKGFDVPNKLAVELRDFDSHSVTNYGEVNERLSLELSYALRKTAATGQVTLNTLFQAAWALLLGRYTGSEEVLFGIVNSGRPEMLDGADEMVGMLVNTLPLRVSIPHDESLRHWFKALQASQIDLQQYAFAPLWQIQQWTEMPERERLFETILVFENIRVEDAGPTPGSGLSATATPPFDRTGYPILLLIAPWERLSIRLTYDADRFEPAVIQRLLEQLVFILGGLAEDPGRSVAQLPLLTDSETRLLRSWNDTGTDDRSEETIVDLFEVQARRTPDAIALEFGDIQLSYRQVDRRANQIGHALLVRGIEPDTPVGLCLPRSPHQVIAVLGILKAACAYVPLDPAYPPARLSHMLENARVSLLVSNTKLAHVADAVQCARLLVDRDRAEIAAQPVEAPRRRAGPDDLAYVIYTSGSTGLPKGIAMPHRPLSNLIRWQLRQGDGTGPKRTLQFSPVSFDVSFQEIFSCWAAGGTLVLVDETIRRNPGALLDYLDEQRIERLFLPFVALAQLVNASAIQGRGPGDLKEVITAGEQLRIDPAMRSFFSQTGACLINQYGPAESHAVTAHSLGENSDDWPVLPPIGRPIDNCRIHVLDRWLRPVPLGVSGELCIAGTGLARGYLNRENLTAERFVEVKLHGVSERVFRTGDLARWHADGSLEFLGRLDRQIKLRGFRIEPGEIESTLTGLPQVSEAVVSVHEAADSDRRLVAHVVLDQKHSTTVETLRGDLAEQLPDYMVPSLFVPVDAMPLTPSGKVNVAALPSPVLDRAAAGTHYQGPRNPIEEALAQLWQEILMLEEPPGIWDDFFHLGGHSLISARMVVLVEERLGKQLPLREFFDDPTIAGVASTLDEKKADDNTQAGHEQESNCTWMSRELYNKLRSYVGSWQGERAHPDSLLVGLNTTGTRSPLFWVFQGQAEMQSLALHMGSDQPLYGMRSGHLVMDYTEDDMQALAMHYVHEILRVCPQGPILVGGNCQGGGIAVTIAQHLLRRKRWVPLLFLMEWSFDLLSYQGPVALLFGRESDIANPYLKYRHPELMWRRAYREYRIEIIPGGHGKFWREPNIQPLAETVARCIADAMEKAPEVMPIDAKQAGIEVFDRPKRLPRGVCFIVRATVTNHSAVPWNAGELSGLMLGNEWGLPDGQVLSLKDGRVPLPALAPGGSCMLYLPVTAPEDQETAILVLRVIEEGVPSQSWQENGGETRWPIHLDAPSDMAGLVVPDLTARYGTPILIGGTGGSGIRVLARILREAGVFLGKNISSSEDSLDTIDSWFQSILAYWNRDIPMGTLQEIASDLDSHLADFLAPLEGGASDRLWGCKQPPSVFFLSQLRRLWPEARCIHLVRDGRDMALSANQDQLNYLGPVALEDSELLLPIQQRSLRLWERLNATLAEYGMEYMPGNYLQISYEDLCEQPEETISRILEFLGIEADSKLLASLVKPSKSIARWRGLAPETIAELTHDARDGLTRFGYLPEVTGPLSGPT